MAQIASAASLKYSTSYNVDGNIDALNNCLFGFVVFSKNILNENNMQICINEFGYVTSEIKYRIENINDYIIEGESYVDIRFDRICFDAIIIYNVPSAINNIITKILTQGVRIWYNSLVARNE